MSLVDVSVPVLEWAQRRSGRRDAEMSGKFSAWPGWLKQEEKPSFADIEKVAQFTRVPIGYFFLTEPPAEELPITDFRVGRGERAPASDGLLETIYLNQRRQAWYEDYLEDFGDPDILTFVGSAQGKSPQEAATIIAEMLDFNIAKRAELRSAEAARKWLAEKFEELGGLVVFNSMVGNNTHRMLDLDEFRGFTLHSLTAPLVFVNSGDTKNGQVFSLLHEFAHVWRGESGVSAGGHPLTGRENRVEQWCDSVAAEIAVPAADLKETFNPFADRTRELERLSARYLCSTLVILLRLADLSLINRNGFDESYQEELRRVLDLMAKSARRSGGTFYNVQPYRIGNKLSRAIIRDANYGRTSMTEALRLLSFRRIPMFDKYAREIGEA